jgi:hypothetical protein
VRVPVKLTLVLSLFLLVALVVSTPALAAGRAAVTIAEKSVFLRDAPDYRAERTYSVFQGQTYPIVGRTADGLWLKLDFAGATKGTWLAAEFGTVTGSLGSAPVVAVQAAAPSAMPATPADASPTPVPSPVWFTVAVKSCFGLSAPDLQGVRVQSLFQGQVFRAGARTADQQWLRIDVTGATTEVWIQSVYGTTQGDVTSLPVAGPFAAPTPAPATVPSSGDGAFYPTSDPVVPLVSAHARAIYQYGLTLGNDPHRFSKVGDCQNVVPFFLAEFDNPGDYRLGSQYAYLQATISNFPGSFARKSEAVRAGFNAASVLDPMWSNPNDCGAKETPLACEFRIHRPGIVIINMETWWADAPASDYEASLRQIVEFSINHGVVPILGTKADNMEKDGSLNAAIVRVAHDYDVPLWNWWAAAQPLPNHGLIFDGFHLTWGRAFFDDPANMQAHAWPWRNLTALQALDAVWRAVR